jgi:hypothetical protein
LHLILFCGKTIMEITYLWEVRMADHGYRATVGLKARTMAEAQKVVAHLREMDGIEFVLEPFQIRSAAAAEEGAAQESRPRVLAQQGLAAVAGGVASGGNWFREQLDEVAQEAEGWPPWRTAGTDRFAPSNEPVTL